MTFGFFACRQDGGQLQAGTENLEPKFKVGQRVYWQGVPGTVRQVMENPAEASGWAYAVRFVAGQSEIAPLEKKISRA